jgi:hypothetical protein
MKGANMGAISRGDIEGAIRAATGNPDTGVIHDAMSTLVDAIDRLINGEPTPAKEQRVIKAEETRKTNSN